MKVLAGLVSLEASLPGVQTACLLAGSSLLPFVCAHVLLVFLPLLTDTNVIRLVSHPYDLI